MLLTTCAILCTSVPACSSTARSDGPAGAPGQDTATSAVASGRTTSASEVLPLLPDPGTDEVLGTPAYGRGSSLVDIDGDGWDDLFLTDTDARLRGEDFHTSRAFRNVDGRFEPWDLGIDPADVYQNGAAAFGDRDNDGLPDVLLVTGNNTGTARLAFYENRTDTEGRFVERTEELGITVTPGQWWSASWADVDVDGWLDLIVTGSATILYRNDEGRGFVDSTSRLGLGALTLDPIHKNPVWVDIDDDGAPDLVSGGGSPSVVFLNDGQGHFSDVTAEALPGDLPANWWVNGFAAAAADFDQDGHEDLFFGRWWYQDYLMLNNGDGTFRRHDVDAGLVKLVAPEDEGQRPREPSPAPTTPTTWRWTIARSPDELRENTMGLLVGDLNDDGVPDVMLGTGDPSRANDDVIFCGELAADERVRFERCGAGLIQSIGPTRQHGLSLGDVDHDGSTDLVINPGGFPPWDAEQGVDTRERARLFKGQGSHDDAVALRLRTRGRPAYGTRVTVLADQERHMTVRSMEGFQSQSSDELRFDVDGPTQVRVMWPGGATSVHTISPGERITIDQPDR